MRKMKRWRYYCEFCNKSGGSGYHMAEHEKHCTLNPNRICRMCGRGEGLGKLIALLPKKEDYVSKGPLFEFLDFAEAVEKTMFVLREEAENCPACILAALRQAGIFIPMIQSFGFAEECKNWMKEMRREYYGE